MAKIDEKDKETIKGMFNDQMQGTAHVRFFGSKDGCDYCNDTREILEELAELSDRINLQILDKEENADEVSRLDVDKFPAIVFVREDGSDTGVRFYGIPSGYEFGTLIEDIIDVANDKTTLSQATLDQLKNITQDVKISVFVTPT